MGSLLVHGVGARAESTGVTGGGQSHNNMQPSAPLNYLIRAGGDFANVGEVRMFAGGYAPGGYLLANGAEVAITSNETLFSLIGTTYGGDGRVTFALPDLRGRAAVHSGAGPGLSPRAVGDAWGSERVTLADSHLPGHTHTLPWSGGGATGSAGGGSAHPNMQPSLGMHGRVALAGIFPSNGGEATTPFLGEVRLHASSFIDSAAYVPADGQTMVINQNMALFALLGTTYGGNGTTNFALPDLRGRAAVGASSSNPWGLGSYTGSETVTLSEDNMPGHVHAVPGDVTGSTGGDQPHANVQPSLTLNYIVATEGIFPTSSTALNDIFLGEIRLLAGNQIPPGWELAHGQMLSIASNPQLFTLLGVTYGGDGEVTFALPDLRGHTAIGMGEGTGLSERVLGERIGTEWETLTVDQLPGHSHTFVPEPGAFSLGLFMAMTGLARRRR
ncbi:MAG TPA: tail fiber protein [Tepidisphaeraceae bacterium]|nr:tail fiber protein [Tepidisphaeraceae bacterium]